MNCEISEVKIDRVNRSGDHHRRSQSMSPGFVPGTGPRVPNDTTDDDEKLPQTTLFGWSVAKRVKVDCIKKLPSPTVSISQSMILHNKCQVSFTKNNLF